jgi:hypothetical protein
VIGAAVRPANPLRGEVDLDLPGLALRLRPTFAALVAIELEIGGLMPAIERAAAGDVRLFDVAALFWHCADNDERRPDRAVLEALLLQAGLGRVATPYRLLLTRIFAGIEQP